MGFLCDWLVRNDDRRWHEVYHPKQAHVNAARDFGIRVI